MATRRARSGPAGIDQFVVAWGLALCSRSFGQHLVLRANDFVRHATQRGAAKSMDTTSSALLDGLRESLESEPVVQEDDSRRLER